MLPIPRHLKDILCECKCDSKGYNIDGKIQCTCGCKDIKLKIYAEEHEDHVAVDKYKDNYGFRIVGICPSCNKKFDIFDMAKHGYDGYVCKDGISVLDSDLKSYHCKVCNNDTFEVEVGIEVEDAEQFKEEVVETEEGFTEEDYVDAFDWIVMSIKCSKCRKKLKDWINFETA